jgi:L-ascorbate metabolism protein UlaG (beta-lactamase superfamily)
MNYKNIQIEWLGHSGFLINYGKIIYTDPFQIDSKSAETKADVILITHEHYDHCSIEDIKKIVKPETLIITVPDCQSKLTQIADKVKSIVLVKPGDRFNLLGAQFEVVPAYNINKKFHAKENEWVGFVIFVNGVKIYHAGDTDAIPEMDKLMNIDIALLPVSGTYTMDAAEAAASANKIKPKLAIPMHYGSGVGTQDDAENFKKLCKIPAEILRKY